MHDIDQITNLKSELTHVQNQLKQKEIIIDSILEGTMAGFWDWYIQDNYEYLSPTFKKMFGYEDHEMENSPESWMKIMHPDDLNMVKENFDHYIKGRGQEPYITEVRFFHKNGSIIWVQCEGKVIEWDEDWNPIRIVITSYSIHYTKLYDNQYFRLCRQEFTGTAFYQYHQKRQRSTIGNGRPKKDKDRLQRKR